MFIRRASWSRVALVFVMLALAGFGVAVVWHSQASVTPIRAAFYYPWFPETWGSAIDPFTNYHPTAGYYSSDDQAIINQHVAAMRYANLDAAISSWWGQGQHSE